MSSVWRELSAVLPRRLVLYDIGARGGLQRPWSPMKELVYAVGFEPDPEEAARLQSQIASDDGTVLPHALWRTAENLKLNLTRNPGCSSLFVPNHAFLKQFPESDRYKVEREIELKTTTLEELALNRQVPPPDVLKVDTQGAELAILEGGKGLLSTHLVGLETEVEFAPIYIDQPLFGDVDAFIRESLGLELWDLRKTYWKYEKGAAVGSPKGRLIFGDALYLRPESGLSRWADQLGAQVAGEKLIMLAVTALAYGYCDYAITVLGSDAARDFVPDSARAALERVTRRLGMAFRPRSAGQVHLYWVLNILARAFQPSHKGWATIGQPLGSRKVSVWWI